MPNRRLEILSLGGEKSFGPMTATVMRAAGDDVKEGIVPDSGHWIMEENPRGDDPAGSRLPDAMSPRSSDSAKRCAADRA